MGANFLKRMDWLNAPRVDGYLRLFAVLNVAAIVWLVATSHGGIDINGYLLGSDFISFWTTGHMLVDHANPYDGAAHILAQRTYYSAEGAYTAFYYPPPFLLFCWPLGWLAYFPALGLWVATTGVFCFAAIHRWCAKAELGKPLWLLFAAFPAVPIVVTHGQTAFLVAGLLGLGAWLVPTRPLFAGVLFGLATIKPQFGLLLPLVLLATGEWRVIASAAFTALALAAVSVGAFGPDAWADWLGASARAQTAMAYGQIGYGKMMSPFAALRLLGGPMTVSYAVQGAVTLAVAGLVLKASWRKAWTPGLAALTLAGAPLATPYVLDYDMVILAFPMLWLAGEGLKNGFRNGERAALFVAFAAPALARPLALYLYVPIMPLAMLLLFEIVRRRVVAAPD
ncbi:MAG: DUF2029 domain-containing protein [Novosphingobium sp.]|nr:DUF2029 domain-containing protein [Novosphingobium sp.]